MTMRLVCGPEGKCDYHADGGDKGDPCVDMCDVKGCGKTEPDGLWFVDSGPGIAESPTALCATHLLAVVRAHILNGTTPEDRAR